MPVGFIFLVAVVLPIVAVGAYLALVVVVFAIPVVLVVWGIYLFWRHYRMAKAVEAQSPKPALPDLSYEEYAARRIAILNNISERTGLTEDESDELRQLRSNLGRP